MNTEALEYFIKVYEKKSATAAAKDLYITPQGISKTIKQLEMELEAELFYRGPRGMEATQAGELLYARAKHIRYLMEDIKKEISIIGGQKRALNVVVTYATSAILPVDYLYRFSEIHSEIQLKLREFPDEISTDMLLGDEIDVGIVMQPEELENCEYELLATGEMVVVVARTHPLAVKDEISLMEMVDETLVIRAAGQDKENSFLITCLEHGFTPNVIHEYGSILSAHRLCERNGTLVISIDLVEKAFGDEKLKMIRLKEKIPQSFYLVTRKRGIQAKAISLFQSYVREKIKSL